MARKPTTWDRYGRLIQLGGLLVVLVIAVIFPLVDTNALNTQIAVYTLIYVGAVVAWNLFSGYSGYISLGGAVFFGSGAYAVGLMTEHWKVVGGDIFWLLPLGGAGGRADRGAVRADRAAGAAAHLRRDHHRHVLHLPAAGLQPLLHRREQRPQLAVLPVERGRLQQPLLLRGAHHRRRHDRAVLAHPQLPVRPAAAGHPGRRGPGPRARRQGHAGQAHRVRDLRDHHRHDRRPVVVLPRPGAPGDRLQPDLRRDRRPDGLPGRLRDARRADPRRADPRADPAVGGGHVQRQGVLLRRDRPRRALPAGDPVHAARDHPHRTRVPGQVAGPAGSGPGGRRPAPPAAPPGTTAVPSTSTPTTGSVR